MVHEERNGLSRVAAWVVCLLAAVPASATLYLLTPDETLLGQADLVVYGGVRLDEQRGDPGQGRLRGHERARQRGACDHGHGGLRFRLSGIITE